MDAESRENAYMVDESKDVLITAINNNLDT